MTKSFTCEYSGTRSNAKNLSEKKQNTQSTETLLQPQSLLSLGDAQAGDACTEHDPHQAPGPTTCTPIPFTQLQRHLMEDTSGQTDLPTSISCAPVQSNEVTHATLFGESPSLLSNCSKDFSEASPRVHTSTTAHYKFNINLARTTLNARGICHREENDDIADQSSGTGNSRTDLPTLHDVRPGEADLDPIWSIPRSEASRLCDVYEEEINISHPFLDMTTIRNNVKRLYDSLEVLSLHGCTNIPLQNTAVIGGDELKLIKIVFATALITERSSPSGLAKSLFDNVKCSVQGRLWGEVDIPTIIIYFLLAMWQFLADNDSLAWRLTGLVARWCLELGLNQSLFISQMQGSDHDRRMAVRLFWCIYTLDRRWGCGNGLPFVIQDSDIDESFPEPDDEVPYLKAMVSFSRMMSTVWYATYASSTDLSSRKGQDEASYLDFQITKWWDDLPEELQLGKKENGEFSRGKQRLRVLLYLRRCQLRILVHQPVLHSALRIRQQTRTAEKVVDLAKDIIRKLDDLNRLTDIYSTQQMCFNYFLVLALGVILLATSQTPDIFAHNVRDEFHAALDLAQSLSGDSFISQRLWKFLRGLKSVGDTLRATGQPPGSHVLDSGANCERDLPIDMAENTLETDMGFVNLTDDVFPMLPPFQMLEDSGDTDQVMENMRSIFGAMEQEWCEGVV